MKKGKLFVVSGPSGTGKGTICKSITAEGKNTKISVSMTTRAPRKGETDEVHYFFVGEDEFKALIEDDGFLEYANVYGNYYGTPKRQVLEWIDEGYNVILEIDVQGGMQIKQAFPQCVLIFILPPSIEELRKRIEGRGTETEEAINRRLGTAVKEISYLDKYDYGVVNECLEKAVSDVESIITAEQCRVSEGEARSIVERFEI